MLEAKDAKVPYHLREYHPRFKSPYDKTISEFRALGASVFCRLVVFKDVVYPRSKPAGALKDANTGKLWENGLKEHWMDPWDADYHRYLTNIARWGKEAGCEEVVLDYVRFPSGGDGSTKHVVYPYVRGGLEGREAAIDDFFKSASATVGKENLSGAIFGITFSNGKEKVIGQNLAKFVEHLNYASGMLYPSHWDCDSLGLKGDPNLYPYEVYDRATTAGLKYLDNHGKTMIVRPFIQVFHVKNIHGGKKDTECTKRGIKIEKVHYGPAEVREEIRAVKKFPGYAGYFLWNPNGRYPKEIFNKKDGSK
jgi:hypothetical protein